MGEFNKGQFEAAQRAWDASLSVTEPKTRKTLERLSAVYFWASIGMGGDGSGRLGGTEPPPARHGGGNRTWGGVARD